MYLFLMPIPCGFYAYSSVVLLEIRDGDNFNRSFVIQDYFSYPGFFVFPVCETDLSVSVRNCVRIPMGIALNL